MSQIAKICPGCQRVFEARRDAKTCSPRCRKRYQRSRDFYFAKDLNWQRQKTTVS